MKILFIWDINVRFLWQTKINMQFIFEPFKRQKKATGAFVESENF